MMARVTRLSIAMTRALKAMAEGDTRIDYVFSTWVTVRGYRVADTTLQALERRGYVKAIGRHHRTRARSRKLTTKATAWLAA